MKKIVSFILAAVLTVGVIPQTFAAEYNYEIYSCDFNDGVNTFTSGADAVAEDDGNGGKCIKFGEYETAENAPMMLLSYLDKESKAEVSADVKLADGTGEVNLVAYVNENDTDQRYVLSTAQVSTSWVHISGVMNIRLRSNVKSVKIAVEAVKDGQYTGMYLDNFKVLSDKNGLNSAPPVEEIKDTGNYTIRMAYETFNTSRMSEEGSPETIMITEEVKAHTGTHSCKVWNRSVSWETVKIYLNEIDPSSKIDISIWIRNEQGQKSRNYLWQAMVPTKQGDKWFDASAWTAATDSDWTEVKGYLDLTQYEVIGTPLVQIVATSWQNGGEDYYNYYVDDLLITADTPGKFYDDMQEEPSKCYNDAPGKSGTAIQTSKNPSEVEYERDLPALKDVYKDYFKIGACVWNWRENSDTNYGKLLKKHFNSLVSNGEFHPTAVIGTNGKCNYNGVDHLMDWAFKNGYTDFAGHALMWDRASMKRFLVDENENYKSRDEVLAWMKEWITNIMRHCEGDADPSEYTGNADPTNWHVDTWDVVNEAVDAVNDDGTTKFKQGHLLNVVGEEYVEYSFKFAEETGYDDVNFRYNDFYNLWPDRSKGIYALIKRLKERGCRVDKVGLQSHYLANTVVFDVLREAMDRYVSTGVHMDITEIDIRAYLLSELDARSMMFEDGVTKERDYDQASVYAGLFDIYREYSDSIDRVNFWTFWDGVSCWDNEGYTHKEYAGIFDRNFKAKPSYWAIADPDKYYNEILDEDTSKTRIRIKDKNLGGDDGADAFVENGTVYAEAVQFIKAFNLPVKANDEKASFISNSIYYSFKAQDKKAIVNFEEKELENAPIQRDGKLYLPVEETTRLIGLYPYYDEHRNIITILYTNYQKQ